MATRKTPKTVTSAVAKARRTPTDAVEAGLQARDLDADAHALLAAAADALGLALLGAEGLHDRHRRERLVGDGRQVALVAALRARALADLAAEDEADHDQQRRGREADQRQHRVDEQQHDGHAQRQQRGLQHLPERVAEELAHVVDVLGDAREQVALLGALVEGEAEALQVVVDRDAQLVRDALAGALHPEVGEVRGGGLGDGDAEDQGADRQDEADVGRVRRLAVG